MSSGLFGQRILKTEQAKRKRKRQDPRDSNVDTNVSDNDNIMHEDPKTKALIHVQGSLWAEALLINTQARFDSVSHPNNDKKRKHLKKFFTNNDFRPSKSELGQNLTSFK